ncbi:MAG: holo-ACP synthase [Desulfitobacteriaceae bacterium]
MFPGVDIIEIERFARACQRQPKIVDRLFTLREQNDLLGKSMQSWAGRFAAKEAILKALGTGLQGLTWQDIEIINGQKGEPLAFLSQRAEVKAKARGGSVVRISISHDRSKAIALAILC